MKSVDDVMADWQEKGRSPHALAYDFADKYGLSEEALDAVNLVIEYTAYRERQAVKAAIERAKKEIRT